MNVETIKRSWRRQGARQTAIKAPLPLTLTPCASGFTLIELILAIGIATVVLITVNTAFFAALRLRDDTAEMVDAASPVDAAVTYIKRDLACAVATTNGTSKLLSGGFRAGDNLTSSGVNGAVSVEMFTATGPLSSSAPWGDIQRVTYELRLPANNSAVGRDLYRTVSRNLLTITTPDITDQLMLNGVASLKFSCYDGTQWDDAWDTTATTAIYTNLPLAVRVDILMAGRSDLKPIEILVPLDAVPRTNMVLTATSTGS